MTFEGETIGVKTLSVTLPYPLSAVVERLAAIEGLTPEKWVAKAAAEKAGTEQATAVFFGKRSAGKAGETLRAILARAPDTRPVPGDELPDELRAELKLEW